MVDYIEEADDAGRAETSAPIAGRTPWHLWAVGALSLLWNLVGATDYTLTHLRNRDWIEAGAANMGVTADQMIAYIESFPGWLHAFWAFGVWGAIAGSILLLARSCHSVWAFALSLLGLAITQFYRVLAPQPDWVGGDLIFNLLLWSVATFLVIYSASMRRKGVLR